MTDSNYMQRALDLHTQLQGKIEVSLKMAISTIDDLALVYTPGVAKPCQCIAQNPELARSLTIKRNSVAVITDGSAVLGLGNIGPLAALPVMEGKALLFKKFANIDAWPICLDTQDTEQIIQTIRYLAPSFGGINLEDIAAPRCFEIEARLQDLGIPVFHDDQHGTAIAVLAALQNSCRFLGKEMENLRVVISGAGAAGGAIASLLAGIEDNYRRVAEIIVCDSKGAIHEGRLDLTPDKQELLTYTNLENLSGCLSDVIHGADLFIGVSKGGVLKPQDVANMNKDGIVFALANPIPEIFPDVAYGAGASIVATGRSDLPNQINNALVFPGLFKGALDAGAKQITFAMKLAAAEAIASFIPEPTQEKIIPSILNPQVAIAVAKAVEKAALLGQTIPLPVLV